MGNKDDISELLQYCMAKPGAEQSVHSDWKATQIKVSDVLFAMVKEVEDQRPAVALKASPELAELLRQQHRDVRPSKHLNKAHWSTVFLDGSAGFANLLPVDASYQQAVKMLPEPVRQQLHYFSIGFRKRAVCEASHSATVSGVPETRISPPLPPSGPRSTIQSAVFITSRLCSITTMVLP